MTLPLRFLATILVTLRRIGFAPFGFRTEGFHHHHHLVYVWGPLRPAHFEVYRWPVETGSDDMSDALRALPPGSPERYHRLGFCAERVFSGRDFREAKDAMRDTFRGAVARGTWWHMFITTLAFITLSACAAAGPIAAVVGNLACGALVSLLGPSGEFWGTACKGIASFITTEIAADTAAPVAAARAASVPGKPCGGSQVVPVPGFEGVAAVCPGMEAAAARGAAKAVAAGKAVAK